MGLRGETVSAFNNPSSLGHAACPSQGCARGAQVSVRAAGLDRGRGAAARASPGPEPDEEADSEYCGHYRDEHLKPVSGAELAGNIDDGMAVDGFLRQG